MLRWRMLALLQFDSVSVPLLERLLEERRLPALAELRSRGSWHTLEAPDARMASAVYHTLYSGTEVADHGLYSAFQWSAPEQRIRPMSSLPKPETVWERLSRAGRRSLVLDPYVSWPTRGMAGVCLSGWQCWHQILLQRWSVPRHAYWTLRRRHGRSPIAEQLVGAPSAPRLLDLSRRLVGTPARAAAAAEDVLAREDFDLLWVTFAQAHLAGHWLWDPTQLFDGELDAESHRTLDSALADIYVAIDEAIARILAVLPEGGDVIVLAPTGMGTNTSRSDLLPGMLEAVLGDRGAKQSNGGRGSATWRVRATVPTRWRDTFARRMPARINRRLLAGLHTRGIDWRRTRAFALPGDIDGLIRLNLRGRERDGIVDPGEAEAVMEEIAIGLGSFHDPDGSPSVASVERVQPRAGLRAEQLPDLAVRWSDRPSAGLAGVRSPRFGEVSRPGVGTGAPGNHLDQAWALLAPGRASRVSELGRPPRLVDIAATVCGRLGADQSGLRGEPLLKPVSAARP
jgi:predicted AlkP superfamily phosphohydrolase/phosphomutase